LLLPKLTDAAGLARLDAEVTRLELASGRSPGAIRFHLLIETVAAVVGLALARAVVRAAALFYGAGDLARETRARLVPDRRTELYTMSRLVLVARATGLDAIDSPCFDLEQPDRLETHTRIGADLGFDGKALIHPSQIEVANRCFTPTPEAVAEARRVLAAYEEAEGAGRGALAVGSQFVDAVHVHMAGNAGARSARRSARMTHGRRLRWLLGLALLTVVVLAARGNAGAESWGGITPGETTRADVERLYGRPSRERSLVDEGRTVAEWTYAEDRAPGGLARMVVSYGLMAGDRFAPDVVRSVTLYPKPQVFTLQSISSGWRQPDAIGTEGRRAGPRSTTAPAVC
jgi:citrate lyase beta subunit